MVLEKAKTAVTKWLFGFALKKAVKRVVQLAVAYATASKLSQYGVDVKLDPELLTAALYGGLDMARNYLKVKYGLKFL